MEFFPDQRSMKQGFLGNNLLSAENQNTCRGIFSFILCTVPDRLDSQGAVVEHPAGEPPD
jgi:hypothetical protein